MIKVEDIKKLGLSSPFVRAGLQLHEHSHCSWDEALMAMVSALVEQNTNMVNQLVRAKAKVPIVIKGPSYRPDGREHKEVAE